MYRHVKMGLLLVHVLILQFLKTQHNTGVTNICFKLGLNTIYNMSERSSLHNND